MNLIRIVIALGAITSTAFMFTPEFRGWQNLIVATLPYGLLGVSSLRSNLPRTAKVSLLVACLLIVGIGLVAMTGASGEDVRDRLVAVDAKLLQIALASIAMLVVLIYPRQSPRPTVRHCVVCSRRFEGMPGVAMCERCAVERELKESAEASSRMPKS